MPHAKRKRATHAKRKRAPHAKRKRATHAKRKRASARRAFIPAKQVFIPEGSSFTEGVFIPAKQVFMSVAPVRVSLLNQLKA